MKTWRLEDESLYYQKGLGLKDQVLGILAREYHSDLVDLIKSRGYHLAVRDLDIYLAKEFGFCYGVDRAVDYAYQSRQKFPDKRIFITGEIIHNPHVNHKLQSMGIQFLSGQDMGASGLEDVKAEDVVILPAFGVTVEAMGALRESGCIMVDTTCGSVLNVWKNVDRYARDGFTSIIHGKYYHEETRATSSRASLHPGGQYLVVRDMAETLTVCDYIAGTGDRHDFMEQFSRAHSPGFDPDQHLVRIGLANQTTMLSSESIAIAKRLEKAMREKFADDYPEHFRSFDTICSATQERQDAALDLVEHNRLDVMVIIGGYNSSNTTNLAAISARHTTTYHIQSPDCIRPDGAICYKPAGRTDEATEPDWLPPGPCKVGITAGASTPNNQIGETIAALCELRGVDVGEIGEVDLV